MPATTPVYSTFCPCRRTRIMSPFGPLTLCSTPNTSTSMDSGFTPSNTVYATPRMPVRIWLTAIVLGFCACEEDTVCPDAKPVKDRQVARNPKANFFINQYPAELDKPHPLRN